MSIKKEVETKNKITVKGTLVSVGANELEIEDDKSGEIETFSFNDMGLFVGKSINLTVADSVKKDIEDNNEDERAEVDE